MNFKVLLHLATDSALLRILRHSGSLVPLESSSDPLRHSDPVWRLSDSILNRMRLLGQECQRCEMDIRKSPFWDLLEFKHIYIDAFEFGRAVWPLQLTVTSLEAHLCLKREVHWDEFVVRVCAPGEGCDEYGAFAWVSKVHVERSGERILSFDSVSRQAVREIFQMLTGTVCDKRIDGLGADPEHPAEFQC